MDQSPNKLVRSNLTKEALFISKREELGNDEDDPLSIRDKSISILGIILAATTIALPAISVFLDRPMLQEYGVISNQRLKKDGY